MTDLHATRAETIPALMASIQEYRALQQPLVDALRRIRDDMDRASKSGDEWAMEWLGDVWNDLPLAARAAGGDQEAAQELAATVRAAARQAAGQPAADPTIADDPVPLRWGLNDVLYGDDDTITVCFSGPDREPYWLELDPDQAAVLRDDLTPPAAGLAAPTNHNTETEALVHVGWWCWRGDNHGHLTTQACRSDNVPLHVPTEWADDMRAVIGRIEDGEDDAAGAES